MDVIKEENNNDAHSNANSYSIAANVHTSSLTSVSKFKFWYNILFSDLPFHHFK